MIQLNLLPDVKIQYLKSQRVKRLVILGMLIATSAAIGLVIFLAFMTYVWDKKSINDLTGDIDKYSGQMGDLSEIEKALTIQYQLNSLTELHQSKPILSRVNQLLEKIVPNDVQLTTVTVDAEEGSIDLKGVATNLERANVFIDTLKFVQFQKVGDDKSRTNIFSGFELGGYNFDGGETSFSVKVIYDEGLFNRAGEIQIELESNKITTRSEVERPNPLFIKPPEKEKQ